MDSSHGPENTPVPLKDAQNHVTESLSKDVESETSIKYPRTVSIWTIIGCVSGHNDEHGIFIRSH